MDSNCITGWDFFFTFHKISYVIDIYRNKAKPLENFADFALYITLFP